MANTKTIGSGIWRMSEEMKNITDELIDNGGEMTEELTQRIESLQLSGGLLVDQIQQVGAYIETQNAVLDSEIKRLQAIKKTRANAAEGVKRFLLSFMINNGIKKIEGDYSTATLCAGRESCKCDEEAIKAQVAQQVADLSKQLPSYITLEVKVAKGEILNMLKAGEPAPGEIVKNPYILIK